MKLNNFDIKKLNESDIKNLHKIIKDITEDELSRIFVIDSECITDENGDKWWLDLADKRNIHRTNGPAIEFANGNVAYLIHGKHHREDGPARIGYENGIYYEYWYLNGIKYKTPEEMPLELYKTYIEWETNKKNKQLEA